MSILYQLYRYRYIDRLIDNWNKDKRFLHKYCVQIPHTQPKLLYQLDTWHM